MKPFREVLERNDARWERLEALVDAYLAKHYPDAEPGRPATADAPDLKELSATITMLKRVQDARRAVQLDARKLEVSPPDDEDANADDDARVSRILQRLEENGEICNGESPDEGAL